MNARMADLSRSSAAKRAERAAVKRALRTGETTLARVFIAPPEPVRRVPIEEILRATPWLGREKVAALLDHLGIDPDVSLGLVNRKQRFEILLAIRARHPRVWQAWQRLAEENG